MQGVFINGIRPKYKKTLIEVVKRGQLANVNLEATSLFGKEYDGPLDQAPRGSYAIVGPDPYTARNWYATITVGDDPVASVRIT